jgi:predicted RNA-binding protein with PUA-like domain
MQYWLIKSEPDAYSFATLVKDKKTSWTGIRNYTARNNLRAMKKGDLLLFYHSNTGKEVVGIAKVVKEHYKDTTGEGDWSAVDIAAVKPFREPVTLATMREHPSLKDMTLWKLGRLSVVPVSEAEYTVILALGKTTP